MLPRNLIAKMASAANAEIDKALLLGSSAMLSPPRSEVGFVAAVTLRAIREIAASWKPILAGSNLSLKLTGIFCHAAPKVKFTGAHGQSKRCELADLLMVVDNKIAGGLARRAALIQAKMARAIAHVSLSGKSSRDQLDLYQNWHPFDFEERAYGMTGVNFCLGGAASDSGTFGIINRHCNPPVWTQHAATPAPCVIPSNQPRLGEFMAEMVDGTQTWFGRDATPSLQTDWSKAIERLMDITYARAFHHKPTLGSGSAQRGVSAFACISSPTIATQMQRVFGGDSGQPPFEVTATGRRWSDPYQHYPHHGRRRSKTAPSPRYTATNMTGPLRGV